MSFIQEIRFTQSYFLRLSIQTVRSLSNLRRVRFGFSDMFSGLISFKKMLPICTVKINYHQYSVGNVWPLLRYILLLYFHSPCTVQLVLNVQHWNLQFQLEYIDCSRSQLVFFSMNARSSVIRGGADEHHVLPASNHRMPCIHWK